ncbi:hypothetical protein QR685DRAFT_119816 [Neurospora intermedia]|uniref:Uncharacterized protein n=1 Tax=Neurospora intermedia TaxID=5142 RepID=A0ABR3D2Q1_NEUIN
MAISRSMRRAGGRHGIGWAWAPAFVVAAATAAPPGDEIRNQDLITLLTGWRKQGTAATYSLLVCTITFLFFLCAGWMRSISDAFTAVRVGSGRGDPRCFATHQSRV